MSRFLAVVMLSSVAASQLLFADVKSQQKATPSVSNLRHADGVLPKLPSAPTGNSTVIGGSILRVDPVRDQLMLKVFGGHSMKIFFDARTQFYRDGVRTSLRNLHSEDHASIETVLDGTNIFARSIHILSKSPEGECRGQVLQYDPGTRVLTVSTALSHESISMTVPSGTPISHVGQAAHLSAVSDPSALPKGTLVSVKFTSGHNGKGVARQIAVLATPGSKFVFSGNILFLDLHSGLLVLTDPHDNNNYKISFDPDRFPMSRDLRQGMHARVTAEFDGTRYVATALTAR
ncbi:MAG: hypothetical protein ABI164_08660 [Acidobacteriaceae bacterium]